MELERIKAAVRAGLTVHWSNAGYTVQVDRYDQWFVTWDKGGRRENSVGLVYGPAMDVFRSWDSVTYQSHKARAGKLVEDERSFYVSWKNLTYLIHDDVSAQTVSCDFKDNGRPRRYVAFNWGGGLMWVAVASYRDNTLVDVDVATELAIDYLMEIGSFTKNDPAQAVMVI